MDTYNTSGNEERNLEYSKNFDRSRVLKHLIKKEKPVIFDVGANDGLSLQEFKLLWRDAIIHCFEPQEDCINLMDSRIKSLDLDRNDITINQVAVGKESKKQVKFYSHNLTTGLSGFNKINVNSSDSIYLNKLKNQSKEAIDQYHDKINHESFVDIIRLDEYMVRSSINYVDLLKIDTQGFEPEVISGMGSLLKNVKVIITEIMFYDYYDRKLSFSDIEQYLLPAGFQLYDISHISKNPMNGRTDWVDVVYVNEKFNR